MSLGTLMHLGTTSRGTHAFKTKPPPLHVPRLQEFLLNVLCCPEKVNSDPTATETVTLANICDLSGNPSDLRTLACLSYARLIQRQNTDTKTPVLAWPISKQTHSDVTGTFSSVKTCTRIHSFSIEYGQCSAPLCSNPVSRCSASSTKHITCGVHWSSWQPQDFMIHDGHGSHCLTSNPGNILQLSLRGGIRTWRGDCMLTIMHEGSPPNSQQCR